MYFKIATSKGNKYLQLVESYRNESGQPRQRLIATIGNISKSSEQEVLRLCQSFLRALGVDHIAWLDDLIPEQSYDYGDVLPVIVLWQKLHLEAIIQQCLSKRVKIDVAKATLIMVANKFVDPPRKLGAWQWYERSVFKFAQEFKHLPAQDKGLLHTLYRSLDYLSDSKVAIEQELYYRLQSYGLDTELVLYDLTSSYVEGDEAELASPGYSRDQRPDRPQIVLGIVTSKQGLPFAHYVFAGNTGDNSTVREVIEDLKVRFGIKHCVLVGDRGLVWRINLDTIRGQEYDYIMGLRRHHSRLVRQLLPFMQHQPTAEVLEIKREQLADDKLSQQLSPQTRLIIGYNEVVRDQVRMHRHQRLQALAELLATLPQEGSLEVVSASNTKVLHYLRQQHLKRYFSVTMAPVEDGAGFRLVVERKQEVLDQEALIDGHYFIQTEVTDQKLTASEVLAAYKSLQKVEHIFRVLKNNIEIRPMYMRTEEHIRGHVMICFLTYLIECLLEQLLKETLADRSLAPLKIELNRVKLVPVKWCNSINSQEKMLYFVTAGNKEVQQFYSALKIKNYRHPERLYFSQQEDGSGNFFNQLSLFPLFSVS